MTAKIIVERINDRHVRVTFNAEIQIIGNLNSADTAGHEKEVPGLASDGIRTSNEGNIKHHEMLTVEEAADLLRISRDKAYYLIRTGQLRSVKIGKLRRVSRLWITEFVEQLEA